jgi:hypothetical protein
MRVAVQQRIAPDAQHSSKTDEQPLHLHTIARRHLLLLLL